MGLLNNIGIACGTDKCFREHPTDPSKNFGHGYLDYYEIFLQAYRSRPITLIEIGVGGEERQDRGGESIRMWEQYFPQGHIIGVDLYQKNMVRNFVQARQTDAVALGALPDADIIIDDASHVNEYSITTFGIMWPKLKPGGIYIWEDIHTSYFDGEGHGGINYGGNKNPDRDEDTTIGYIKRMEDQLQYDSLDEQYRWPNAHEFEWIFRIRNSVMIKKRG